MPGATPFEWTWMRPPWMPEGDVANPYDHPPRLPFEIESLRARGASRRVDEQIVFSGPFAELTALTPEGAADAPPVALVTPMSGHYGLILRDLVVALLRAHRVFVLDWPSARFAPRDAGSFGFEDNIEAVMRAARAIGPGAHLVGVCQGAPPTLAAAALLHQEGDENRPASIALLGAPVDPEAAPSRVARLLRATAPDALARGALEPVMDGYPGAGRRVYPAASQLRGLLTHLARDWAEDGALYRTLRANDGLDPDRFPAFSVYTRVKDIEGQAFLENIETVFRERLLARGALDWRGLRVRPEAARDLAVMTVEAAEDRVAPPGQTEAAHALFSATPEARRGRLILPEGGHLSLFHGPAARRVVTPALAEFFARIDGRSGAASRVTS